MGSLSSVIGSIYYMPSVIGSIYRTSGIIYSTGSPASLGASPAFSIIGIFVIGSLFSVIESIPGIFGSFYCISSFFGSPYCFSSVAMSCAVGVELL